MMPHHGIKRAGADTGLESGPRARSSDGDIAWRELPPRRRGLELYVWGKHPAWRDFIDGAQLPPPPDAFRDFHRTLRTPIERIYANADCDARLLLWEDRAGSALVLLLPSHDAIDPATGRSRRSPLFVGMSARGAGAIELLSMARHELPALAGALRVESLAAEEFLSLVRAAQSAWAAPSGSARREIPSAPPVSDHKDLSDLVQSAALGLSVDRSPNRRQFTMACGRVMGSAHILPVGVARITPEAIRQAILAPDRPRADANGRRSSVSRGAANPLQAGSAHSAVPPISGPSLPPAQSTTCDTPVIFSTAAGTAIRLASANPRRKSIRVRLSARRGTIRLASAAGLSFSLGEGAGDRVVMEFGGSVGVVNSALDGLRFTPSRGFTGLAELRVTAQDQSLNRIIETSIMIEVRGDVAAPA